MEVFISISYSSSSTHNNKPGRGASKYLMAAFLFCCCFSNSLYLSFFKFDYVLPAALALDGLPVCGGAPRAGVLDVAEPEW